MIHGDTGGRGAIRTRSADFERVLGREPLEDFLHWYVQALERGEGFGAQEAPRHFGLDTLAYDD